MLKYLAVGNLSKGNVMVKATDMRIFFPIPEVEFLNVGPGSDAFGKQVRPARAIIQDALRGTYDLVVAGHNAFPYPNPRKTWVKNLSNLCWKTLCHPNLWQGGRFPYAKLGARLAAVDLDDRPIIDNRWFHVLEHCVCFFKRELPQNPCNAFLYTTAKTECNGNVLSYEKYRRWIQKLRPISLGIAPDICRQFAHAEFPKKTDIFFAGQTKNRPNRIAGLKQLERLKQAGLKVDIAPEKLSQEEFLVRSAEAYIVWSPEGYGWDCFRHYEIALMGSVPLMQSPTIQRYAPLVEGQHAIYYWIEGDDLMVRVQQALQNRSRLVAMGRAARQHVLQWHTHAALGHYVMEETRRTLAETGRPDSLRQN